MNKIAAVVGLVVVVAFVLVQGDTCPDHKTRCGTKQTCCSDNKGSFGCCPYPRATCCSDGRHCCPSGSKCDIEHSRCIQNSKSSNQPEWWTMIYNSFTADEWLNQNMAGENQDDVNGTDSAHNTTMVGNKSCGGGQSCPDKYTCCQLASGGWGCCPFNNGVCCPDKIHCCPSGKTCDAHERRCI